MARYPLILALFLAVSSCAASQKPAPIEPEPAPAPQVPSVPPPAPELGVALTLRPASADWTATPLNEWQASKNFLARLEHGVTHAWYAVQGVPVSPKDTIESFAFRVLRNAAMSGVETSPLFFAADGKSAWFYYEAYGSDQRGKVFLLRKPGVPVALVVQSTWPLSAQEATLPDIDAMNAAIDYTAKK